MEANHLLKQVVELNYSLFCKDSGLLGCDAALPG